MSVIFSDGMRGSGQIQVERPLSSAEISGPLEPRDQHDGHDHNQHSAQTDRRDDESRIGRHQHLLKEWLENG